MKKYKWIYITLFLFLFLLQGCQQQLEPETPPKVNISIPQEPQEGGKDEKTGLETLEINMDDGQNVIKASFYIPDLSDYVSKGAQDTVKSYYEKHYTKLRTYWTQQLAPERIESMKQIREKDPDQILQPALVFEENYEITYHSDKLVSVKRLSEQYTGGASSHNVLESETFLTSNGALLMLPDLFSVEMDTALSRIYQGIREQAEGRKAELFENVEKMLSPSFDASRFYLTSDGIVFYYPAYSIAPGAAGIQEFLLPWDTFTDILKEEYKG